MNIGRSTARATMTVVVGLLFGCSGADPVQEEITPEPPKPVIKAYAYRYDVLKGGGSQQWVAIKAFDANGAQIADAVVKVNGNQVLPGVVLEFPHGEPVSIEVTIDGITYADSRVMPGDCTIVPDERISVAWVHDSPEDYVFVVDHTNSTGNTERIVYDSRNSSSDINSPHVIQVAPLPRGEYEVKYFGLNLSQGAFPGSHPDSFIWVMNGCRLRFTE